MALAEAQNQPTNRGRAFPFLLPMMAYGEEAMTVANDAVAEDKDQRQRR